jgi:hypothetical protein
MIAQDSIGPNQHQHIRPFLALAAARLLVLLKLQAPLDLGTNGCRGSGQSHGNRVSAGMKNEPLGSALQIDRLAIIAAFASIRHQRMPLLLALPRLLQLSKSSFHADQVFTEPDHLRLGSRCLFACQDYRLPLLF